MSAGNSGGLLNYSPSDSLIVVSATGSNDALASFSSYGPYVDVAAPGVSIYTTNRGGGYSYASGTSFSSPITAAIIALMLSANPDLTPADASDIIKSTAIDLGAPGFDYLYGHGRIDAKRAVEAAYTQISFDNIPPVISISSPTGGEVSGTVPVDVNYSDNKAVVKVELYVNDKKTITDTQAPFAFAWDTTQLTDGNYTLTAHAFDAAGNQGTSAAVSVTVKNVTTSTTPDAPSGPKITSTNLSDGMRVGRYQTVNATASDEQGISRISFSVNGQELAVSHGSTLSYRWHTWDSGRKGSLLTATLEAVNHDGQAISQTFQIRN